MANKIVVFVTIIILTCVAFFYYHKYLFEPPVTPCLITGCSRQLCQEEEAVTTCEWQEEYSCLTYAKCAPQDSGKCGWTETWLYKLCKLGLKYKLNIIK